MKKFTINAGRVPPPAQAPKAGRIPQPKRWTFSFQYWRQIEFFGVDQCNKGWFISFLDRLAELSRMSIEDFLKSHAQQDALRYHEINWNHKNVPIRRDDIDWIGPIRQSEDFAFFQFQVSTALGRVVGFFDENEIFQIVLLDPLHNIQPSGNFDYRVRTTHPGQCHLSALIGRFENAISTHQDISMDVKKQLLTSMHENYVNFTDGAVFFSLPKPDIDLAHTLMADGVAAKFGEFLQIALHNLKEN
ncbi:hypothetical protein [Methylobacterium tarhaniae]|uniref:hypothetical protein n=1 Tax=Methylobacterium tarhaniae TaxID=1187852 RepID=UPI003D090D28